MVLHEQIRPKEVCGDVNFSSQKDGRLLEVGA